MNYFISKPKSKKNDKTVENEIIKCIKSANIVENIELADEIVFCKGWTRSKICMEHYEYARIHHIKTSEWYYYTDKYKVHLN